MITFPLASKSSTLRQTFIFLLDQCKSMKELKLIHSQIITSGFSNDEFLASKVLFFCSISDCGDTEYSYHVLRNSSEPKTFNWNTIIRGYAKSKNPNKAISSYNEMLTTGLSPDYMTYPFLVKSCARLTSFELGSSVHCSIVKYGLESDRFIQNSLIHMYSSCRNIENARKVFDGISQRCLVSWNAMMDAYAKSRDLRTAQKIFDEMPAHDVVSWSTLITGYVKAENFREALIIFEKMQFLQVKPNEVTMVGLLCACAHLGALDKGRKLHEYVNLHGLPKTLTLKTSLIDMYFKCGSVKEAIDVFRAIPNSQTDVLIWNAVIGGLAANGMIKDSLALFEEMRSCGIIPDEITFLSLLTACAHGGLVKEAWDFFKSLNDGDLVPSIEHYACIVDVLSRAGHLNDAYEFIKVMPLDPTASMLGALLSGCNTHGRTDLGQVVGKMLIELDPDHDGRYIGVSNAYARSKQWDEAKRMREVMEKRGIKKAPAFSSVDINGHYHGFIAHDKAHSQSREIYSVLNYVAGQMKLEGGDFIEECNPSV